MIRFDIKEKDLPEIAWGIIANAYGGDWDLATPEWKEAAENWRNNYHKTLPNTKEGEITKEFPEGKDNYCPQCYFGSPPDFKGKGVVLRENCKGHI